MLAADNAFTIPMKALAVFEALLPCYKCGLGFVTRIDLLSRD